MFDKQARFRVGEFDGEKECAAGNEVSAITRHRIFVFGLSVGEGTVCCLGFNFVEVEVFRRYQRSSESASFNEVKN
ncbi:hypothetical protein COI25_07465 [Neisseria meningitidis]|uniref:hypothetical protein n=1 Tax=Neisseria meningitidis TaxID=487 RepID=UPI000F44AEA7|nr:hypothetical protein [Neisseria meningitidis]RNK10224.1 hypothetical protein COI25_07465 [Neisseria meningitidis]RQK79317.1 hypothetical protein COH53_06195 [Neisseria meningitidis]